MPVHQISVVPIRETASNGRNSGRSKERSKEAEVRPLFGSSARFPGHRAPPADSSRTHSPAKRKNPVQFVFRFVREAELSFSRVRFEGV